MDLCLIVIAVVNGIYALTDQHLLLKEKYTVSVQALVDHVPRPGVSAMTLSVKSILVCSMLCVNHVECVAFAYSETSNVCTGSRYQNPLTSVLFVTSGFNFYAFSPGNCPRNDYTYISDLRLCLKIYLAGETQPDAKSACQSDGGRLARITNQWKNEAIAKQFIKEVPADKVWMWISGQDDLVESEWRFDDGTLMTYTNFDPNDLSFPPTDDCAMMKRSPYETWGVLHCTLWKIPFVCEMSSF